MMKKIYITFLLILISLISISGILNKQINVNFEQLPTMDQNALKSANSVYKNWKNQEIWEGFDITKIPTLIVKNRFQAGYLINPIKPPQSLDVVKINLPSEFDIEVYRIASLSINKLQYDILVEEYDESYLFGNHLSYLRFNHDIMSDTESPFSTIIVHEAFHEFMQQNWLHYGSRWSPDVMTDEDKQLYVDQLHVFSKMANNINEGGSEEELKTIVKEYLDIVNQFYSQNPQFAKMYYSMQVNEGVAQYIGCKAGELNNDVCYVNEEYPNPPQDFSRVYNIFELNDKDKESLAYNDLPYKTGQLLCYVLNKIGPKDYQKRLNEQTIQEPLLFEDILKECVSD